MADKLHQPYRKQLIRGYDAVEKSAVAAGAYGMVISGAGPTLLALSDISQADKVATAMADTWQQQEVEAQATALKLDHQGAVTQK